MRPKTSKRLQKPKKQLAISVKAVPKQAEPACDFYGSACRSGCN